ncbi:PilZ domain-containing protein [Humidesulfovibrio idahonensis]
MESPLERRQFGRLHLLAYGRDKTCTVEIDGASFVAVLIDISSGGARLKHVPPPALPASAKIVTFSVQNLDDGGLLQQLAAAVRWRNGQELGIKFDQSLDVGIHTLQKLVC